MLYTNSEMLLLAKKFGEFMREDLEPAQLVKVIAANKAHRSAGRVDICESGDYIDSNMTMDRAFTSVFKREMDAACQRDADVVNAAWKFSKEKDFYKVDSLAVFKEFILSRLLVTQHLENVEGTSAYFHYTTTHLSGDIGLTPEGGFVCQVGNDDVATVDLREAEQFLFNKWFLDDVADEVSLSEMYDICWAIDQQLNSEGTRLANYMKSEDWHHMQTGGGCTAYGKDITPSSYMMMTLADDSSVPTSFSDPVLIYLYLRDDDGDDECFIEMANNVPVRDALGLVRSRLHEV